MYLIPILNGGKQLNGPYSKGTSQQMEANGLSLMVQVRELLPIFFFLLGYLGQCILNNAHADTFSMLYFFSFVYI